MTSDVIIVGAGPVGLMLACELRLTGVNVIVLEKIDAPTGLSKALGIMGRGEDYLDMRGLLDRFRRRAPPAPPMNLLHFALIPLDIRKTSLSPKGVFVPQAITEEILEERACELGVVVRRGVTVTSLVQLGDGVKIETTEHGRRVEHHARYVVGCDGARSIVRHEAGIGFTGTEPTSVLRLGDVKLEPGQPTPPMVVPLGDGWLRLITKEPLPPDLDPSTPMTLDELRASAMRVFRTDLRLREARWLSRFTDATRQADAYRRDRVLIAGDAAHIHLPAGGPGLLTGFGDALNLGWKLSAVVHGRAPAAILDTYDTDRRPVAAHVLDHTRAQGRLTSPDDGSLALRALMSELVEIPAVVEHFAHMLWQTNIRYRAPSDSKHPLVGAFVPQMTIVTNDGPTPILSLLRQGRWLAIETRPTFDERIERLGATRITATSIESDAKVAAILVRPDGHVAWVDDAGESFATTVDAWTC